MPSARPRPTTELCVELLGGPVCIRCDDPDLAERLAMCYGRSPRRDAGGGDPLSATLERGPDGFLVRVTGRAPRTAADAVAALRTFNHELLHAVMLRAPELYYVHAAVVELAGRGVVLPGLSRAGKSTLALAFVAAGAGFLSDELLAFDPAAGVARAFPRAIKIRDACVERFPLLADRFVGHGEGRFLPFSALDPDVAYPATAIAAIVLPRWSGEGGATELRPVSRGDALLELAASSLNFGTHRARSLDCLAQLVQGTRAFALAWNDPHEAVRLVARTLGGEQT